jgi:hypothetical protein
VAVAVRSEIDRQRRIDGRYPANQDALLRRIEAVLGAQRALSQRRPDAPYELRQGLVDLAATAEALAGELPAPRLATRR